VIFASLLVLSVVISAAAAPSVRVYADKLELHRGDDFQIWVSAENPDQEVEVDFYLLLRTPSGTYLFWPGFTTRPEWLTVTLPAQFSLDPTMLFEMQVAEASSLGTYTWYGVITRAGETTIFGDYGQVSVNVTSTSPPLAAFASANPMRGEAPLNVSFHGDATGGIAPYRFYWDFESDGIFESQGQDVQHEYEAPGMFEAVLAVVDADGTQAYDYLTINVSAKLSVEAVADPDSGNAPLSVSFMAIAEGGFEPYTYEWDFQGDGRVDDTARAPEFTYTSEGRYSCTALVRDSTGQMAWDMITITVDSAQAPSGMVLVPAGEFTMGSTENGTMSDETPVHQVWLDSYYIDRYPVTNSQYREFVLDTGNPEPAFWDDDNFNQPDQPVVGISQQEAQVYCLWTGKLLPTEA